MSMTLDPTALYNINYNKTSSEASKLEDKINNSDLSSASDDELMSVCKEFESYFLEQIFKGMEKMIPKTEKSSNNEVEMFSDMAYQDIAAKATEKTDFGIAQKLYEQMKRNYGLD